MSEVLHFFYVEFKKDKTNNLLIYKSNDLEIEFNKINSLLYNYIYSNENNEDNKINYFEYFYIKKGLVLKNTNNIWKELFTLFLNKCEIFKIINEEYINNLYNKNMLLFDLQIYNKELRQFLTNYYKTNYIFESDDTILNKNNK